MHEFGEVISLPPEIENTPNAENVLGGAKKVEKIVYRLVKALGSQWFHE